MGIERCCSKMTKHCSCSREGTSYSGNKRSAADLMESLVEANNE